MLPSYAIYSNNDPDFQTMEAYEDYLDEYLSNDDFRPSIVSYDNYLHAQITNPPAKYFYNINIIKEKAQERICWGIVDIKATGNPSFNPDESYIRFSVNSHLAYGFKGIIYYSYEDPFVIAMVQNGVPTYKYYWAQNLNKYIKNVVGPAIMKTRYLGAVHKSDFNDENGNIIESLLEPNQYIDSDNTPVVSDLSDPKSLAGIFYDYILNLSYLYIVNKGYGDNHGSISTNIFLRGDKRNKVFSTSTIGPDWGYYPIPISFDGTKSYFNVSLLAPGAGKLFKIIDYGYGAWNDKYVGNYGDATNHPVPEDYDGDGKTDLSVKADNGYWKIDYANNGFGSWDVSLPQYGASDAHPVPEDYDGDGKADLSVKTDAGSWYINYAYNGFTNGWDVIFSGYGDATNQPVPEDYDGDGKTDLSVKADNGYWKIDYANNGFGSWDVSLPQYGASDAHPVPEDYDGDGKADLSVKTDAGSWYINYAYNGFTNGWDVIFPGYGDATNHPVPEDYDGDGKADFSIKSDGQNWKIDFSKNGYGIWDEINCLYGDQTAIPVPADYNGDGKADLSVKTDWSDWYIDYAGYEKNYKDLPMNSESMYRNTSRIQVDNENNFPEIQVSTYPNPFNSETTINYITPNADFVILDIFDILGKKVESLVNEFQMKGLHRITVNFSKLSSGIYFYALSYNKKHYQGKMIHLK
ncbi:MAG TPA: T9SS type A sorting domain-containing protein [Ignavibacteriaceae bacterium]|nr:T9SS type A sorting domain-containing protein [Ignavibacteriaceae bacterium]